MVYLSDPLIVQLKHDLIWEYMMTPIVLSGGQTSIKCVRETMGTAVTIFLLFISARFPHVRLSFHSILIPSL